MASLLYISLHIAGFLLFMAMAVHGTVEYFKKESVRSMLSVIASYVVVLVVFVYIPIGWIEMNMNAKEKSETQTVLNTELFKK